MSKQMFRATTKKNNVEMKRRGKKTCVFTVAKTDFVLFFFCGARYTLNENEANCDEQINKNEREQHIHVHNWASDRFKIRMHAHDIYLITN